MLHCLVYIGPVSNCPPLLSPPCLITVSKECCRKPLHHRPLRTPVFRRFATLPLSAGSALLENIPGGIPSDHNQPHLRAAARSPLLSSERFEISEINFCPDHVRAQHCCAPACPGVNPAPICFFPRITFHFLSLLLLSHVVDSAIIKGAH